jgi:sugar phosphate isomerase/epimerase
MQIGAMNHPRRPVEEEIRWMVEMGLDFIDLTLEPPAAAPELIDVPRVRELLEKNGMGIVGHTAYYLPLAHAFEEVRKGVVSAFVQSAEVFAALGAKLMNIHPDPRAPMHDRAFLIERNVHSLREIIAACRSLGITLMVENLPGSFNTAEQLGELLAPLPELGLHLDLGHTNLDVVENSTVSILNRWGKRLKHIHLHDNLGGTADLHLPLGAGTVDLTASLRALKDSGYDATITLEVFAPDSGLLLYSVEKLKSCWNAL